MRKRFKRRTLWIVGGIVVLLIALRLALPTVVERYVNRTLDRIPGYRGHVGDVDLWLIRGAYKIKNFDLKKIESNVPVPFFKAEEADLSVQWKALFEGKVVGEIFLDKPQLNFTAASKKKDEQLGIDHEWLDAVKDLFPLKINRFEITNGEIHYRDFETSPKVDVKLMQVGIIGSNLSNTRSATQGLEATINGTARAENKALLKVNSRIKPSERRPTFVLDASLEKFPVTAINDFLKAYANFDVTEGTISVYTEMAANKGRVEGYVKPLIHDLNILDLRQDAKNPLSLIWEGIIATLVEAFTNHGKDQIGAAVPFSGDISNPETDTWQGIVSMFGNAFVRALKPGVEKEIKISRPAEAENK